MSKDILLIAAVAGAAVLMLNKAKAQVAPAGSASAPQPVTNVNAQLWQQLAGGALGYLNSTKDSDGSPAFLLKNFFGQTVTTDGKPVSEEVIDLYPAVYGGWGELEVDVGLGGGKDYTQLLWPGLGGF